MSDRPILGGETEIALALVDLSGDLDLTQQVGSSVPVSGDYTVVTCTQDIRIRLPVDNVKAIANGWNPVAQLIPDRSNPGQLAFAGLLKGEDTLRATFNGKLCVARLRHIIDDTVVDTHYCTYFNPALEVLYPEGDGNATISGDGMFVLYTP